MIFAVFLLKIINMKKNRFYFLSFIFLLLLNSCSVSKITYDKSVDFTSYKTFAFYKKGIDALKMSPTKKKIVLKAISQALQQKGFVKSSRPDIIVNVFTDIHKRIDVYPDYYSPFYRRYYMEKSKEGYVYVDIIDMHQKKVIWSGRRYVNYQINDMRAINKAIFKLLEKFPPKK